MTANFLIIINKNQQLRHIRGSYYNKTTKVYSQTLI